jgi:aminoglycoside phosphotransferase (APT) family kinase protein
LSLRSVESSGTDNALFRLGDQYIVRLPRIEWVPGSNEITLIKEYEWLPKIATFLETPIALPIFKGNPDNAYPWSWLVSRWNEGQNPSFEQENEYEQLAIDLAIFLNDFHKIELPNGPFSRRGVPLIKEDEETRKAISALEEEIDISAAISLWEQVLKVPSWNKSPVWIHGDFLPGNILIQNNRLSAVIDFTDLGIGDPACDLIIAWSLLNSHLRGIFRDHLENIDNDTWERGRGWALSIALIMLAYYKHTNPPLAKLARRMIKNLLE